MQLREDEEFLENEKPRVKESKNIRITKTKFMMKDDYDEDDKRIEIHRTNGGGLKFEFTTHQEVTKEKVVTCDMGHKHREIVTEDYSYETVCIGRKEAKMLLNWLQGDFES